MALTGSYFDITRTEIGATTSSVTYPSDFAVVELRGTTEEVYEPIISESIVEVEGQYAIISQLDNDWVDDGAGSKHYTTELQVRVYSSEASRKENKDNHVYKVYIPLNTFDNDQPLYPQSYTLLKQHDSFISMSNV